MHAHVLAPEHDETRREDTILVLRRATWADYQRMMEMRGDKSAPRISFLDGEMEIMSPSAPHEEIKGAIGCLVEVYCLENDIDFLTLGSWTLENKALKTGVEADECYVFGPRRETDRPDLAIEVVWTSGGIHKLEAYARLGVKEVWFWRRGALTAHCLREGEYEEVARSEVLPGIDLVQLVSFLDRPTTSAAMRGYRDALRK